MSTHATSAGRILSGSMASWVKILVTVITQIIFVPIYLSQWNVETYGAWLLLQALFGMGILLNLSVHDYVGFECLKLGENKREEISIRISSVIPVVFLITCILVLMAWVFGKLDLAEILLKIDYKLAEQWNEALVIMFIVYLFTVSQSGLIERWMIPFGYYPMFAWLNVLRAIVISISPALAVFMGADFLEAVWSLVISDMIYHIFYYYVSFQALSKESLRLKVPQMKLAFSLWFMSLWLALRYLIDMTRQHGSRLILAPLTTPEGVAAFATIRTGANFAQQGLVTIIIPALPELMKFLKNRDQEKIESIFALVWLVTCAVLAPALLAVQFIMPDLFELWTRGKIEFNSDLFALLSLTILVFALGQPLDSVVRGNNLLRAQVIIASIGAFFVLIGMVIFVPSLGITGAGIALLLAEIIVAISYIFVARKWMLSAGMHFPWKPILITFTSLIVTAVGLFVISRGSNMVIPIIIVIFIMQIIITWFYWQNIPNVAKNKAKALFLKFRRK